MGPKATQAASKPSEWQSLLGAGGTCHRSQVLDWLLIGVGSSEPQRGEPVWPAGVMPHGGLGVCLPGL